MTEKVDTNKELSFEKIEIDEEVDRKPNEKDTSRDLIQNTFELDSINVTTESEFPIELDVECEV